MGIVDYLEWLGAISGLLGAYLLATNTSVSRYGWVAFFIANLALIGFSVGIGRFGLLVQQAGFMGSSILGLYRTGFFRYFRK